MQIVQVFLFVFLLLMFHESGHVIAAKLLKLPIRSIGFRFRPYPHFYVAVKWPKSEFQKYIYLFSGTFFTMILFVVSLFNHFFEITLLYWAFIIQFAIEINPFYSDFTIAFVSSNKANKNVRSDANRDYKIQYQKYQYTAKWYIHFITWTLLIVLLIKFKNKLL